MEPVIWLGSVVFTVILTVILTEPIHRMLLGLLGGITPPIPRDPRGIWRSTYRYKSRGHAHVETQIMELRRIGNYVVGRNVAGRFYKHKLRGRVRDSYLTGTWENILEGVRYHGAFQFFLLPDGSKMEGSWVGYNRRNEIQHGWWHWQQLSKETGKRAREQFAQRLEEPEASTTPI